MSRGFTDTTVPQEKTAPKRPIHQGHRAAQIHIHPYQSRCITCGGPREPRAYPVCKPCQKKG